MTVFTKSFSDAAEKKLIVERAQDVTDIVETNKFLQGEEQRSDWGRHIARVPVIVIEKWLNEEYARGNTQLRYLGPGFDEWFAKKIKEPDNKAWRVDNPSNPFFVGYGS